MQFPCSNAMCGMLTHVGIMSLPTFFFCGMALAFVVALGAGRLLDAGRERIRDRAAEAA